MLTTATRGLAFLERRAATQLAAFVVSRQHSDGGFCGRDGASDLYYTLFGLMCCHAAGHAPASAVGDYLAGFTAPADLDLVHLACLVRARAIALGPEGVKKDGAAVLCLESFRSEEGGYGLARSLARGSVYAGFLAFLAYDDLGLVVPDPQGLQSSVGAHATADGGYADAGDTATTTVTAAALLLLSALGMPPGAVATECLRAMRCPTGGFRASMDAPVPDLLSTASALYALSHLGGVTEDTGVACIEYVEGLWQEAGGFCGSEFDRVPDCEYTFYGLLALGSAV